jgi:anti-anti-sigma factor
MRADAVEKLGSGMLASDEKEERAGKAIEKRIEEWVIHNLEGRSCHNAGTLWDDVIGMHPSLKRLSKKQERQIAKDGDWGRFRLSERHGIATLRLTDTMLIKEQIVDEFTSDLLELINAGYDRVILNFAGVERLSVQVIVGLTEAHLRCAAALGGQLKLCGIRDEIREGLELVGLHGAVDLYPDEQAATDSLWPVSGPFRPLPVNVLSMIRLYEAEEVQDEGVPLIMSQRDVQSGAKPPESPSIRLIVQSGQTAGRSLKVGSRRMIIGREDGCALRVVAPSVSRIHASIDPQHGRFFLRDLNSTNGTRWNDRILRDEEVELKHGDVIGIGPLLLRVEARAATLAPVVESRITPEEVWLQEGATELGPMKASQATLHDFSLEREEASGGSAQVAVQKVQDITIITPLQSDLDSEFEISPIRSEFQILMRQARSRKVVVSLKNVSHVSSQAIALLVAYTMKLEREGGELRLSEVCPRVMAVLNQIRLPMLIEIYPTTDEAALCAWRNAPRGKPGVAG